ncbi:MAG TPA: DUF4267 domain-containing protein [Solirubrobacterales bacterium]|nr:DUF4267 domain-containing protein [Solirubrobacterales bacterium]
MARHLPIDPLARQAVVAIGAGRVAIGIGALFATRPALRALGFGETDATGTALAKVLGARDLTLGLVTLAAREDRGALRAAALAAAALDAADAVAFSYALADPETRQAGLAGVATASAAALAGAWAWRRLS